MTKVDLIASGVPEATLQKYANRVTRHVLRAVTEILAAGSELNEIKSKIPHGDFLRMFTGHPHAIATPIPFSERTGQRLMAIAAHPVLTNPTHVSALPPHWGTLYDLSQLPTSTVTKALTDGRIHPEMERHDVLLLKKPSTKAPRRAGTLRDRVDAQREIASTLRGLWQRFPDEHAFLLDEIDALAGRRRETEEDD